MIPTLGLAGLGRGEVSVSAAVAAAWSATRKTANVTLSNADRILSVTNNVEGEVRSNVSINAGKIYVEVEATDASAVGGSSVAIGLKLAANAVDRSIVAAGTYSYRCNGQIRSGGTVVSTVGTYVTNDTIGIAVDFSAGKIWFARNNTWQGSGANPATGANPAITFTPGGALDFLFWTDNVSGTKQGTARFVAGQNGYSPPAGFTAGV